MHVGRFPSQSLWYLGFEELAELGLQFDCCQKLTNRKSRQSCERHGRDLVVWKITDQALGKTFIEYHLHQIKPRNPRFEPP